MLWQVLSTQKWVSDKVKWKCFFILGLEISSELNSFHNSSLHRLFFLWCHSNYHCIKFLFCWDTKKLFRKTVVMMFNFKMTWYIPGVLYLLAQLLVPFLIAVFFWLLSTLLKSVSQILSQPSAAPASKLISASIKWWSPGLMKWTGQARIFPYISLPGSSKGYLQDTCFYLAVQYSPRN